MNDFQRKIAILRMIVGTLNVVILSDDGKDGCLLTEDLIRVADKSDVRMNPALIEGSSIVIRTSL